MNGIWLEDTRELERQAHKMMAHQVLPYPAVGYGVEFGDHPAFGDPAAWIHLYVPGDATVTDDEARVLAASMTDLSLKLKDIVPHRLTAVLIDRPPAEQARTLPRADL